MSNVKLIIALLGLIALSACTGRSGTNTPRGLNEPPSNTVAYFNEIIGDTVLFAVDQSTLTADSRLLLNKQAAWLLDYPKHTILIEGHADEQGTREYNLALGARRAAAVANYLVSRGLTDARVHTLTFGKERPLALCSDEACWSKNRRAVTLVDGGARLGQR